ncbi:alpha/beta fold hydrolase [Mesorhizobium sp. ASY16-5R]|uniref:alpha/beta fold hydrolase n=1 Tax=Mesorhizobium sp. ASY16-5R TaxID=3445772 RepID=UPI003F9F6F83
MTDFFFEIPGNPVPDNASGGYIRTPDGFRLRYACFAPDGGASRGTVVILTGRNECIEKYFETIRDLASKGLGSAVMDWRGQGASDRLIRDPMRGHVVSFDDYVTDLVQFFTGIVERDCPGPYFILAHSTGSLIALMASASLAGKVRRMVLVAPFLGARGLPLSTKNIKRLMNLFYWVGIRRLYAYGGRRPPGPPLFSTNKLTTDEARFQRNTLLYQTHPGLALGGPTVSWVRAAAIAAEKVQDPAFVAGFRIPSLFISAGADEVVSTQAIEDYAQRLKTASLVTIDGARHEILQEADLYREQLLAAFNAFVPGSGVEPADAAAVRPAADTQRRA